MILAQKTMDDVLGRITPPAGTIGAGENPISALGRVIGVGINLTLTIAGITVLIYMLWGSLEWITSGGDKEKLDKARNKIVNAVVGIIIYIVIISIWAFLTGNILGIAKFENGSIQFNIPTFKQGPVNPGGNEPRPGGGNGPGGEQKPTPF